MKILKKEFQSVSYSRILDQNRPEFYIPILRFLGRKTGRIFLDKISVITSVKHQYVLHAMITHKTFTVDTKSVESAGNILLTDATSSNINDWLCQDLIERSMEQSCNDGIFEYKGILNGSIDTHSCEPNINCPTCSGSGICQECNKKGVITCPVCSGNTECSVCGGEGNICCPNCNGYGTVDCDECEGSGEEDCYMCDGTGNCTVCNGTGEVNGKSCRRCNGSGKCNRCHGRSTFYCKSCDGSGTQTCSACDGDTEITCPSCHGSGICATCNGEGSVICPTCHHSGQCPDCKGTGLQKCPRCNGTGFYQTYKTYTVRVKSSKYKFSSWSDNDQQLFHSLNGLSIYNDRYYAMDSEIVSQNDIDNLLQKAGQNSAFKNWIRSISPTYAKALQSYAKLEHIPLTEVFYKVGRNEFSFFIVGTNNAIIYTKLPSLIASYLG